MNKKNRNITMKDLNFILGEYEKEFAKCDAKGEERPENLVTVYGFLLDTKAKLEKYSPKKNEQKWKPKPIKGSRLYQNPDGSLTREPWSVEDIKDYF